MQSRWSARLGSNICLWCGWNVCRWTDHCVRIGMRCGKHWHAQWTGIAWCKQWKWCDLWCSHGGHILNTKTSRIDSLALCNFQAWCKLLFPFRSTILEPGFDLHLRQIQCFRKFHSLAHAQIFILFEFIFQFFQLFHTVRLSRLTINARLTWTFPQQFWT